VGAFCELNWARHAISFAVDSGAAIMEWAGANDVRRLAFVGAVALVGLVLYAVKKYILFFYSSLEIAFALAVISVTLTMHDAKPTSFATVFGSLYILVRGFENFGKALERIRSAFEEMSTAQQTKAAIDDVSQIRIELATSRDKFVEYEAALNRERNDLVSMRQRLSKARDALEARLGAPSEKSAREEVLGHLSDLEAAEEHYEGMVQRHLEVRHKLSETSVRVLEKLQEVEEYQQALETPWPYGVSPRGRS
jgi:hypothetical protein